MSTYSQFRVEIHEQIMNQLKVYEDWTEEDIEKLIEDRILDYGQKRYLSIDTRLLLKQEIFNSIRRLGIIQELIDRDDISEIMINGKEHIFYEEKGMIKRWDKQFESDDSLDNLVQQIVARSNKVINETTPITDLVLADGSRVNIVLKPIALNGPIITIRKFPKEAITVEDLVGFGTISRDVAMFLEKLVVSGYNILVSGGTSSGKTTLLNALSNFIPENERVITIEDAAELQVQGIENLIRMEARKANFEGENQIDIRDLIKTSLRMAPTRIIVGEVRGEEAVDMINAMNTGHDGSFSTIHANSAEDMITRLETMILMGLDIPIEAVRKQICSAVDIIIQIGRLRDRSRAVLEIVEVVGYKDKEVQLNPLYTFEENMDIYMFDVAKEESRYDCQGHVVKGKLVKTVNQMIHTKKLQKLGYVE